MMKEKHDSTIDEPARHLKNILGRKAKKDTRKSTTLNWELVR